FFDGERDLAHGAELAFSLVDCGHGAGERELAQLQLLDAVADARSGKASARRATVVATGLLVGVFDHLAATIIARSGAVVATVSAAAQRESADGDSDDRREATGERRYPGAPWGCPLLPFNCGSVDALGSGAVGRRLHTNDGVRIRQFGHGLVFRVRCLV